MDVVSGIAAINTAIEIVRKINGAKGALETATLKVELAGVISQLADAKISLTDAKENIAKQQAEIEALQESIKFEEETIVERQLHYRKRADGRPVGRPFCPRCWEVDCKWISMQQKKDSGAMYCWCPECKIEISATSYVE